MFILAHAWTENEHREPWTTHRAVIRMYAVGCAFVFGYGDNVVVSCIASDLSTFQNSDACFSISILVNSRFECIIDVAQDSGQLCAIAWPFARSRFLTILKDTLFDRKWNWFQFNISDAHTLRSAHHRRMAMVSSFETSKWKFYFVSSPSLSLSPVSQEHLTLNVFINNEFISH